MSQLVLWPVKARTLNTGPQHFTPACNRNKPDALQLMNGSRKCGINTELSITHPAIRNNDMRFEDKWMLLECRETLEQCKCWNCCNVETTPHIPAQHQ
jgi:hypothetical protein